MPALRKVSPKLFTKTVVTKGYGFHTPQDGSVCKIKVISDKNEIITDLDESQEKEIIVGDVDEPIDRIIEDCVRTMKEEEVCCLRFDHPSNQSDYIIPMDSVMEIKDININNVVDAEDESKSIDPQTEIKDTYETETADPDIDKTKLEVELGSTSEAGLEGSTLEAGPDGSAPEAELDRPTPEAESDGSDLGVIKTKSEVELDDKVTSEEAKESQEANMIEAEFQLMSYTREPEIWEMSVTEKWRRASYHKQRGLELYSRGSYQYAFRRFGLTLKYVISLEHDVPSGQEEGMDIKGLKLSCYLNVAACQMRHHNYESVVINSTKALELQPNNAKALYRRGSALLQLQEYEKAKIDLTTAQELEPKNQAVAKQLQLLKSQVQKLNQYYATAMKKLFT